MTDNEPDSRPITRTDLANVVIVYRCTLFVQERSGATRLA